MLHGAEYDLGWTGPLGTAGLLGKVQWFDDKDYTPADQDSPIASKSASKCKAILVYNRSGGTLAASQVVAWDTSNEGPFKAVTSAGAGDEGVGVVSHALTTTVANGEAFWLVVAGPTELQYGGSVAIAMGTRVSSGLASGRTQKATGGDGTLIYANTASSTAHTNTTDAANLDVSYSIAANTLRAGDVLRIRAACVCPSTNSTDTLTLLLTVGGVTVATTGAVDVANNDIGFFDATVTVRTIGASGTMIAHGLVGLGVPGTVTGKIFSLASSSVDTTAEVPIYINADWSAQSTSDQVVLTQLVVYIERAGGDVYPIVGTALETVAYNATAGTQYRAIVNFQNESMVQ
jgi:hypothetical protein